MVIYELPDRKGLSSIGVLGVEGEHIIEQISSFLLASAGVGRCGQTTLPDHLK